MGNQTNKYFPLYIFCGKWIYFNAETGRIEAYQINNIPESVTNCLCANYSYEKDVYLDRYKRPVDSGWMSRKRVEVYYDRENMLVGSVLINYINGRQPSIKWSTVNSNSGKDYLNKCLNGLYEINREHPLSVDRSMPSIYNSIGSRKHITYAEYMDIINKDVTGEGDKIVEEDIDVKTSDTGGLKEEVAVEQSSSDLEDHKDASEDVEGQNEEEAVSVIYEMNPASHASYIEESEEPELDKAEEAASTMRYPYSGYVITEGNMQDTQEEIQEEIQEETAGNTEYYDDRLSTRQYKYTLKIMYSGDKITIPVEEYDMLRPAILDILESSGINQYTALVSIEIDDGYVGCIVERMDAACNVKVHYRWGKRQIGEYEISSYRAYYIEQRKRNRTRFR